jgi:hypothetical protein
MKKLSLFSLIWLFLVLVGCAPFVFLAAGAGAGVVGVKFLEGQVVAVYQASFIDTWDATERVLLAMQIQSLTKKHDQTSGKFEGTLADTRSVAIYLSYKNSQETEVRIRVTTFGDEKTSLDIHEKIRKELFGG